MRWRDEKRDGLGRNDTLCPPTRYPQWFGKTQRESREINRNLVMYAFRERDKKRMLCTLDVNKATSQIKTKVEFIKFKRNFVLDTIKVFGIFGNL